MKIYLVERTDIVTYDEYDSFIVIAKSPKRALRICYEKTREQGWDCAIFKKENTTIKILKPSGTKDKIILGSFNAG